MPRQSNLGALIKNKKAEAIDAMVRNLTDTYGMP
jgi:hypothetical protein